MPKKRGGADALASYETQREVAAQLEGAPAGVAPTPRELPEAAVTESGFLRRRQHVGQGRDRWSFLQVGVRREEYEALRRAAPRDEGIRRLLDRVERSLNVGPAATE